MLNKKLISLCLAAIMTASAVPTSVLAASMGSSSADANIGEDVVQNAQTKYSEFSEGTVDTEVYLTVNNKDIIVGVPTEVIVSGTPNDRGSYVGEYAVSVKGNIAGNELICVTPDSETVTLQQTGKSNKTANILQEQIMFDCNEIANGTTTNGIITAEGLTAGSWHSNFNFNVSIVKINRYYSSIELAAQDINNNTINSETSVADMPTAEGAACGVYKNSSTGTYRIEVYKDLSNVQAITLNENTEIDLNDHLITFVNGSGITFEKNLTVTDGEINTTNSVALNQTVPAHDYALVTKGVTYNCEATANKVSAVASNCGTNIVDNCKINITGSGNSSVYCDGLDFLDKTGSATISNTNIDMYLLETQSAGLLTYGSLTGDNLNINIRSDSKVVSNLGLFGVIAFGTYTSLYDVNITQDASSSINKCCEGIRIDSGTENGSQAVLENINVNINSLFESLPSKLLTSNGIYLKSVSSCLLKNCNSNVVACSGTAIRNGYYTNATSFNNKNNLTIDGGYYFVNAFKTKNGDARNKAIENSAKLTIKENSGKVYAHGGNSAIGIRGVTTSTNIYGGTFCSANHGGIYDDGFAGSITNIYGGKFYNTQTAGEETVSGVTAFGGFYCGANSIINIENATIMGGASGLRIKNDDSVSVPETVTGSNVTISNSYVEGTNRAFSIDVGQLTINEGVTTKYGTQEIQQNGGTVVDNRR